MITRALPSLFAFALLVASGCSGGSTGVHPAPGDGGSSADDLAMATPDLATAPDLAQAPDLSTFASGACTNQMDQAVLMAKGAQLQMIIGNCAQTNFAQEPATKNCIKTMTGLSDGCSTCFDTEVNCAFMKCLNQCIQDPNSMPCTQCRAMNCDPGFITCSGLKP